MLKLFALYAAPLALFAALALCGCGELEFGPRPQPWPDGGAAVVEADAGPDGGE